MVNSSPANEEGFCMWHGNRTHQVVESDALLSTTHVLKEAIICNEQQPAGVFLVIMSLPLLSVVVTCHGRERKRVTETQKLPHLNSHG